MTVRCEIEKKREDGYRVVNVIKVEDYECYSVRSLTKTYIVWDRGYRTAVIFLKDYYPSVIRF